MRKIIVCVLTSLIILVSFAQSRVALNVLGSRPLRGFYTANNDKKSLTVEKLKKQAQENGWILRNIETQAVNKFGDKTYVVKSYEYIPFSEIADYNMEVMSLGFNRSIRDCDKQCMLYFYIGENKQFERLNMKWSGETKDGYAEGVGCGYAQSNGKYYAVSGNFSNGVLIGVGEFRRHVLQGSNELMEGNHTVEKIKMSSYYGGMAGIELNEKIGFVNDAMIKSRPGIASITIEPKYAKDQIIDGFGVQGDFAIVLNDKKQEIKIDRNGNNIGYSRKQNDIFERERAEEARKVAEAEAARKKAEAEALLAKQEAEKKAAIRKQKIEANKNIKLWDKGSRLCFEHKLGIVSATLEEWNSDKSKAKVKIVTSPSSTATYKGEVLEKNNTIWINTKGDGWHLALDEELDESISSDNSTKKVYVQTSSSSSSSSSSGPSYSTCTSCRGTGRTSCSSCKGTGQRSTSSWGDDGEYETCTSCHGTGSYRCSSCSGTGRR